MRGLIAELARRGDELVSLGSCLLNVLIGTGDREATLSAGSWELRRRGTAWGLILVWLIDGLNWPFNGPMHCARAWTDHAPIWTKIKADKSSLDDRLEPS